MFATILVPLDGSSLAERALPYAVPLARAMGGHLVLVRAVAAHTFPGTDPTEAQVALTQQAESDLTAVAERVRADGVEAESVVYYDDPVSAILDAARRREAKLIVMSTHGRSGLGRWIYGSVADQVLRRAEAPVLLMPATADRRWSGGARRILVPLDGSDLAEEALILAAELARGLAAELYLLQVVEPPTSAYAEGYAFTEFDPEPELVGARRYLEGCAVGLRAAGRNVTVQSVLGQPAQAVATIAREQSADLIVMATHGRGGLARLVMGSVATGILQRSTVPLLLVRPAALHRSAADSSAAGGRVAGRCFFCHRPYYGDLSAVSAEERCLRCGFHLHSCGNCLYFDTIGCVLQRPEAIDSVPGQRCPAFAFRWERTAPPAETRA
ncbi:MAG: universal stress protein [Chloroflexi bacterium]|nr:universal stress protein [Chloroflexota bacterium]